MGQFFPISELGLPLAKLSSRQLLSQSLTGGRGVTLWFSLNLLQTYIVQLAMPDDYIHTLLTTSNLLTALQFQKVSPLEVKPKLDYLAEKVRIAVQQRAGEIDSKIQKTLKH